MPGSQCRLQHRARVPTSQAEGFIRSPIAFYRFEPLRGTIDAPNAYTGVNICASIAILLMAYLAVGKRIRAF